jgi:hypothetical protein
MILPRSSLFVTIIVGPGLFKQPGIQIQVGQGVGLAELARIRGVLEDERAEFRLSDTAFQVGGVWMGWRAAIGGQGWSSALG